ncbi:hypothetical protein FSP39_011539 [Pinctada imbricata]|uniref:Tc1-like transposase DDE domain-containing protein n=1 Tax=Pinctada imbricata TaxID=66713 RepID=A0AA88YG75_PINIB|nr:hypothetical protein FSP39_011539 [Pinctada imbricata]
MATRMNVRGRPYTNGKAISDDLRELIVSALIENGADKETGKVPRGIFTKVSMQFKVSNSSATNIWKKNCEDGSVSRRPGGVKPRKLSDGDIGLIQTIVGTTPSISYKKISEELEKYSATGRVQEQLIGKAVRKYLPSGENTRKIITRQNRNRYTDGNMAYTQWYLNYIQQKNVRKLKFFDESGFKITDANKRYGHSPIGEKCIEIGKYVATPNLTLNFMVSLDGVSYYNFVEGAADTDNFVEFFYEAAESYTSIGMPVLEPGDVVVLDNCPTHKHEGERRAKDFLGRMGIELVFLPVYSPDLNPAEMCFSKIKTLLKDESYQNLVPANLKVAIGMAISEISVSNVKGYYRCTEYLQV